MSQQGHRGAVDAGPVERGEQAVVRGRGERGGDLLAGQVGDVGDPGAVAGDERLVVPGHVEDPGDLVGDVQRRRQAARHGAGPDRREIHRAGDERGVDARARIELGPLDVVVRQRVLQPALVHDDQIAAGEGLVGDADGAATGFVRCVGGVAAAGGQPSEQGGQGEGGGQAAPAAGWGHGSLFSRVHGGRDRLPGFRGWWWSGGTARRQPRPRHGRRRRSIARRQPSISSPERPIANSPRITTSDCR
jgi:hypothetical protein